VQRGYYLEISSENKKQSMRSKKMRLQVIGEHPSWMRLRACRFVEEMIETLLDQAGLDNGVGGTMRFSRDASIRKRKGRPSGEITLRPANMHNNLVLFVVGDDAREDLCEVTVNMPQGACNTLALFIKGLPEERWMVKKKEMTPEFELPGDEGVVVGAPPPDMDSLALYLDSIRDLGGEVTLVGAGALAVSLTANQDIVGQVMKLGLLRESSGVYSLTDVGEELVAARIGKSQSPEITPLPHRFDILRKALSSAKATHDRVKAENDQHVDSRTELNRQLKAARNAEAAAAGILSRLERNLKDVRESHEKLRKLTLRAEAECRGLPDERELHRAEIELQRAQKEYNEFISTP
jgi:hypothetical protein